MKYLLAKRILKRKRKKQNGTPLGFRINKKGKAIKRKKLEYIPGR